jgi:hypothetical protein
VGGAKGIVDIDIGEAGEALREGRITFLLLRVEPEVLEEDDVPAVHPGDRALDLRADAFLERKNRPVEEDREPVCHEGEAQPLHDHPLRLVQVGAEDDPCITFAEVADRRQAGPDTVSSAMEPSSLSGTLRSARTSTRFPRTSMSRTVFFRLVVAFCMLTYPRSGGTVLRDGARPISAELRYSRAYLHQHNSVRPGDAQTFRSAAELILLAAGKSF